VSSGSLVFSLVFSPVFSLQISVSPFFVLMVKIGANPMKEYCASFFGPSMDSSRYAVS
jgi:hypothetical protein